MAAYFIFLLFLVMNATLALSANADRAMRLFLEANSRYENADLQGARLLYERAIELDKRNADYFCNLASVLVDLGELKEAEMAYRESLLRSPQHPSALFNYAMLLQDQKKFRDAIYFYEKLIDIERKNADAYSNIGSCYYEEGMFESARASFSQAIVLTESTGSFDSDLLSSLYEYLGRANIRLKRDEEAVSGLNKALILNPKNDVARHILASLQHNRNMGGSQEIEGASSSYVTKLFDDYAANFDESLSTLQYRAPSLLVAAVREATAASSSTRDSGGAQPSPYTFSMVVDLGCGTGIFGEEAARSGLIASPSDASRMGIGDLEEEASSEASPTPPSLVGPAPVVVGVDLSGRMLSFADGKGIYSHLFSGEVVDFLRKFSGIARHIGIEIEMDRDVCHYKNEADEGESSSSGGHGRARVVCEDDRDNVGVDGDDDSDGQISRRKFAGSSIWEVADLPDLSTDINKTSSSSLLVAESDGSMSPGAQSLVQDMRWLRELATRQQKFTQSLEKKGRVETPDKFLRPRPMLLVAADVFVYFGKLDAVFAAASSVTEREDMFAFTVEKMDDDYGKDEGDGSSVCRMGVANIPGDESGSMSGSEEFCIETSKGGSWAIQRSGRFAHSSSYVKSLATSNGFEVLILKEIVPRIEEGTPVQGYLVVLQRL